MIHLVFSLGTCRNNDTLHPLTSRCVISTYLLASLILIASNNLMQFSLFLESNYDALGYKSGKRDYDDDRV